MLFVIFHLAFAIWHSFHKSCGAGYENAITARQLANDKSKREMALYFPVAARSFLFELPVMNAATSL